MIGDASFASEYTSRAEAFAERVGARQTRRNAPYEWRTRCPAHNGTSDTSLKITEGDGGCATEDVLAKVGASWADLFPPNGRQPNKGARVSVGGKTASQAKAPLPWSRREFFGPVTATYPYHDLGGTEVGRVTRHQTPTGKTIRPWHLDERGEWVLGAGDATWPPYRLPELLSADHADVIFIGEGEKVADAAGVAGLVATTNVGGAGKWSPELATWFEGRHVVILPDNDEPGRKHAEMVATSLHEVAASVKVVELSGLPPKGDAVDWFESGGTADELQRLARVAPQWNPSEASESTSGPSLVITSMDKVEPREIDWLWERWLARGKLHIIGGHVGDGKSTLLAAQAAEHSRGGTLPDGSRAARARWLFLLAEDALDDTFRPRLDAHHADVSQVFAIEAVRDEGGADRLFNIGDHLPILEAEIGRLAIDVLVIDPVTSFMPRSDRNAEGDVRDILTPLGKLAERTGVAVIAVMHVGKPNGTGRRPVQQLLGATAFGAIARVVWMVAPVPDDEGGNRRVLGVVKSNIAMKPEPMEWSRAEDGPVTWHGVSQHRLDDLLSGSTAQPRDDAEGFLSEILKGGSKTAREIFGLAKVAGVSERTLRRAADDLSVIRYKTPGVTNGPWLWWLPDGPGPGEHDNIDRRESKMATPLDTNVATFESSDRYGKMATDTDRGHLRQHDNIDPAQSKMATNTRYGHDIEDGHALEGGHLPIDTGRFEGGHMDKLRSGHLRSADESAGGGKEIVTWTG